MKNKDVSNFWIGFFAAALAVVWLIWLRRQKRELSPPPMIVERRQKVEIEQAHKEQPVVADPLERIKGIGPVYATRLNEAGVMTFAQLAASDPSVIGDITGATTGAAANWIQDARELMES